MTGIIVFMGACAAFLGLCPAVENEDGVEVASIGLAGCGVAAMLAVIVRGAL